MAEFKHGSVTIQLPDGYELREKAGKLTVQEVSRLTRVPKGIGRLCELTADSVEKAWGKISLPAHITPDSMRAAGKKAEMLDTAIYETEVALDKMRQSWMQDKAEAFEMVCQVNDIVRGYGKRNRDVWSLFGLALDFLDKIRGRRRARIAPEPLEPTPPVVPTKQ
jgi:hypothetical protein